MLSEALFLRYMLVAVLPGSARGVTFSIVTYAKEIVLFLE